MYNFEFSISYHHTFISMVERSTFDRPVLISQGCIEFLKHDFLTRILRGDLSQTTTTWRVAPLGLRRSIREYECINLDATFAQFDNWRYSSEDIDENNPFFILKKEQVSVYADYKHFRELFSEYDDISFIDWSQLGVKGSYNALDSTLWLGTSGVHTPLHFDTYSSNIIAQIHGEKRWRLWPPNHKLLTASKSSITFPEASQLPTLRVPYEESSIYSSYDPKLRNDVIPFMDIILKPGDVLMIPKHWWHFVETVIKILIPVIYSFILFLKLYLYCFLYVITFYLYIILTVILHNIHTVQ